MKRKKLTKTVMMISNCKRNLWPPRFSLKKFSALRVIVISTFTLSLLIMIIIDLNIFYQPIRSLSLGMKCVFKHQDLQLSQFKQM